MSTDPMLERAKGIFCDALDRDPEARDTLLSERCGGDGDLRARVEGLLEAHERSDQVFGDPASPWGPCGARLVRPVPSELRPGDVLGPYRIVATAGSGGFGTVYQAEQTYPVTRRVALKVLRHGLDSDAARARFDAERQALARMEHPAIARVFDAGTTDDQRPYFAMEFVPGQPLTDYCEERRLDLKGRLELFRTICQAVQHAHQKGVIHRDLKPSNVLVTEVDGAAHPKVIDFGVAKAIDRPLTDLSLVSVDGQLIGTPAYMSPEQAAGEVDVDTRTDVYGLGALLYELLAGKPPFDSGELGFATLLHSIAHRDPVRPSQRAASGDSATRVSRVPADLDWIAMRCLEKERTRRYPSAGSLAADVERFLDGRPVEAAPPSTLYRLRKLTRRHRFAAASLAALVVALGAGGVGTGAGLVRARRANEQLQQALGRVQEEAARARAAERTAGEEALRAVAQWEVAQAVNQFVTDDLLAAAVPSTERGKGRDVRLREVLDVAAEEIELAGRPDGRFGDKPVVEASIRDMLGSVYAELGELDRSIHHLERAVELRSEALGAAHPDTLGSRSRLAGQLRRRGELGASEDMLVDVLETQRKVLGGEDVGVLVSELRLGQLRLEQGRHDQALEILSAANERARRALPRNSPTAINLLNALAIATQASGRDAEAESYFREALARRRASRGDGHPQTVGSMINLASLLRVQTRFDEAGELLEEAYAVQREVLGDDHPTTITALYNLGALAEEEGRVEEAEPMLRATLEGFEQAYGAGHPDTLRSLGALGRNLASQGRRDEAEQLLRQALEGTRAALGADHPTTDSRRKDLAAFLFHSEGREEELLALLEESLESQRRSQGAGHPNTLRSAANLALQLRRQGELERAEELLVQAAEGFRLITGPDHLEVLRTESDLVGLYIDLGRLEEAEPMARRHVEVAQRTLPVDSYDLARFRLRLGLVLEDTGGEDQALEQFELAHESLMRVRGPADPMTAFAAEALAAHHRERGPD
jgi:serine/threonine protein kinase